MSGPRRSSYRANELAGEVSRMRDLFERSAIDRRTFMQGLTWIGLSTVAAGNIVAGATAALAQTPKMGGRLRGVISQHGPSDTLDPAKGAGGIDYCRGFQMYNTLVDLDEKITPQPGLAESWEPNADASEWIFKLRRDVTFHNGKTFTSADVVYSLLRHLDPAIGSTGTSLVEEASEIKAEDDYTVRFVLKGPNADFPVNLGVSQMFIVPDGHTDFNGDRIGTGPFIMTEFQPGIRSLATRNPNYWREGKPYLDEIEWFGITDSIARLNALLSGDIHLMGDLDVNAIPDVEAASGVEVLSTRAGQYVNIVMKRDQEPFANADLTRAIKHLMDREKVLERVFKGYGMIGADHPISPVDPMYPEEVAPLAYDLDRAKFLLQKSGLQNVPLTLHTSTGAHASAVDLALMLQRDVQQIGLNLEVQREPADGYWSDVWLQKPMHVAAWNMRPTANIMLGLTLQSDAVWNESGFRNERFDKLLIEARSVTDLVKRKAMYAEMLLLARDHAGLGIPAFIDYIDGKSTKVQGMPANPLGPLGGYTFPEYVWLDG